MSDRCPNRTGPCLGKTDAERADGGKVTRHDLRPDLYPDKPKAVHPPKGRASREAAQ